jgi:anti-sigma B factor antagonist
MEVTTHQYKRCDVVAASGRVDSQTAPQLEAVFQEILDAGRFNIVFDINDIDFVSSAGLRVMIAVQKTCKKWNRGELVLTNVPQRIYETLDLAGFVPLFQIHDDVVEAVGSF